ncbi:MAG: ABC transporter substrate-binding protein [Stackebrandtia sp.]
MNIRERKGRRAVFAAAAAASLLAAGACSGDDGDVVLTVQVFGGAGFGYEKLVEQFEADNPGITVDYQIVTDDYDNEFRPNLIQQLDAGDGAGDVVGIEEQGVGQMMALSDYWVDLSEYGLDSRESDYADWKWDLGYTEDGKLAGLGTDVGGMAMCYRTDLFAEAGLPVDRDEVSALWPDWEGFTAAGEEFVASGVDAAFVDSPNQLYNTRMVQEAGDADGVSYFDRDGEFALADSPAVRTAFDYIAELTDRKIMGEFQNWTDGWFQAMQAGGFATMGCPAWMLGVIADNSGEDNAGNWDVAAVPGGSGNWGGSWLGVPAQSEHPEEAAKLASYLTSPESQIAAFEAISAFPSSPQAQADPQVAELAHPYFNDAPSGQIFADSVADFAPVHYGELHSAVRVEVENVLFTMVQGEVSGSQAWDAFVAAGQEVVDTSM